MVIEIALSETPSVRYIFWMRLSDMDHGEPVNVIGKTREFLSFDQLTRVPLSE